MKKFHKLFISKRVAVRFMLLIGCSLIFVFSVIAQPTSLRSFPKQARIQMTADRLEELKKISNEMRNNTSKIELYKKRVDIYGDLLWLNYDNNDWVIYAENLEKDLSQLVKIEKTAEVYKNRGLWLFSIFESRTGKIYGTPLEKFSEIYPKNHYIEVASSDFLQAISLNRNSAEIIENYTFLGVLFSTRPRALILAPDFPKWKNKIPFKLVRQDFETSIKYILKALELSPKEETSRSNVVSIYLTNAEVATKLGDTATAQKYKEAAEKYRQ